MVSMSRLLATELMDDERASDDPAQWRGTLDDLARFNALLGGTRALGDALAALSPLPRTLIDVACGGADMTVSALEKLRALGVDATAIGLDRSEKVLAAAAARIGARTDIRLVRGDATALPFPDGHFDVAVMNLALHHLEPPDAIKALAELVRVARTAIVNDLRRSRLAWLLARITFPLFSRYRFIRHDGPISALRAYTPEEARGLATAAGWSRLSVERRFAFRMILVGARG